MTFKYGDSVWVKATTRNVAVDGSVGVKVSGALTEVWPDEIRTDADFTNPLDEAIVDAVKRLCSSSKVTRDVLQRPANVEVDLCAYNGLEIRLQEKLDAEKPKTAEEIIGAALQSEPIPIGTRLRQEQAEKAANALRSAGLLKESL